MSAAVHSALFREGEVEIVQVEHLEYKLKGSELQRFHLSI
jgi:hypothetical protein